MALRRGRAPSHSLTTQASRSWPSRLTTAINPSKNQECKRQPSLPDRGPTCSLATCSPAHLSRLWHSTRLDIRVRGALFRCAQTRRAHNNGALPIVLTRLHTSHRVFCLQSLGPSGPYRSGRPGPNATTGTAKPDGRRAVSAL